jgi:hypothetical protein
VREQKIEHLFFLDYDSHPIVLTPDYAYKVIETRVVDLRLDYLYEALSFWHLVVEVDL